MGSAMLERGREAFARQAWGEAFESLTAAGESSPLGADDLERAAVAAYLTGRDPTSDDLWTRAHQAFLDGNDPEGAARCAVRVGMSLFGRGETAHAGGWFARAGRLLDDGSRACAELGHLLVPQALERLFGGDPEAALGIFEQIAALGEQFGDADLRALSRLGRGQAMLMLGRVREGVVLLDEAMVSVTAGETSPIISGLVYCAVIDACTTIFDVGRAGEWTAALSDWCASQPDLVPYRGQCLVHRSQIMLLHGEWQDAMAEAERARERLSDPPNPALGEAYYQLAELHRLRGAVGEAEAAYRLGNEQGRSPQPGLALLRLQQGRVDAAQASIRTSLDEARDPPSRSRLLPSFVEIMLACGDAAAARAGAEELKQLAGTMSAPMLHAAAAAATGATLLAEGDTRAALAKLREAAAGWQALEAPYETARVRALTGLAYRALGDEDSSELELETAGKLFEQLGAAPDLDRLRASSGTRKTAGGLTARELEILTLIATGKTNKSIAAELVISEKTVARHVSNIFTKLGLSSRAAATAYAYEHDLVPSRPT